jgi:hypothetical protein
MIRLTIAILNCTEVVAFKEDAPWKLMLATTPSARVARPTIRKWTSVAAKMKNAGSLRHSNFVILSALVIRH